jgi:peroxiredoxin
MVSPVWEVAALAGWAVLVLNLLLTLRVVRWLLSAREAQRLDRERSRLPELALGEPAPSFRATDVSGRPVELEDYLGRETALVFVSPQCGSCRREIPALQVLAGRARQGAGAAIVLVSDGDAADTQAWLSQMREEDNFDLTIPMLIAPRKKTELAVRYNPRAFTPYFCHIDRDGNVTARGGLHSVTWAGIVKGWDASSNSGRVLRQYR